MPFFLLGAPFRAELGAADPVRSGNGPRDFAELGFRASEQAWAPIVDPSSNNGRGLVDTQEVRPTYEEELDSLEATYTGIREWDAAQLRSALGRLASGPAAFAASGGMLCVAVIAAQLHERYALQPGTALTPLGLMARPALPDSGAMLFTSSAKHPDALEVMRRLGRSGMRPAVVMTHRNPSDVALPEAKVIGLPPLTLREGFLAVNSVMSMASAMVRGYAGEVLPVTLAEAEADPWPTAVDRLLVLFPPSLAAVATDLETRVSELGLAAVQLADYRNFAHGRHTGLDRTLDRTTIVALSDKESRPLADATLKALPDQASIVRWNSQAAWPTSALELLQVSLRASGKLGAAQNVSMARPKVPLFGRRLYRLPLRKRIPDVLNGSVDRKLDAAGGALIGDELRNRYETAFDAWKKSVAEVRFHGLVVDYDGTVCTTEGRFFPPEPLIAEQMNRLLGEGLSLGFASGRGPSLHRDLREVIDTAHWSKVQLGLYNGGYLTTLADELEDLTEPNGLIEEAVARIETLPVAAALRRVPRRVQLTLEPADGARVNPSKLAAVVQEVLARDPPVPVRVVRSGHSLDIVPASTTKVAVRDRLTALTYGEILAVGDQGQVGGNDFELLAASPWTVSVERCSADPTRCWYVGDGSDSGPRLLVRYLRSLVKRRSGFAFRVGGLS